MYMFIRYTLQLAYINIYQKQVNVLSEEFQHLCIQKKVRNTTGLISKSYCSAFCSGVVLFHLINIILYEKFAEIIVLAITKLNCISPFFLSKLFWVLPQNQIIGHWITKRNVLGFALCDNLKRALGFEWN